MKSDDIIVKKKRKNGTHAQILDDFHALPPGRNLWLQAVSVKKNVNLGRFRRSRIKFA